MLEAWLVNPDEFVTYAETTHGFMLGLVCFLTGFLFVSLQDTFWNALTEVRSLAVAFALIMYLVRWFHFQFQGVPNGLIALESMLWMLAILGFGAIYLNRPSRALEYLNTAVYPVYIVHMPVQFLLALLVLPLPLAAALNCFAAHRDVGGSLLHEVCLSR